MFKSPLRPMFGRYKNGHKLDSEEGGGVCKGASRGQEVSFLPCTRTLAPLTCFQDTDSRPSHLLPPSPGALLPGSQRGGEEGTAHVQCPEEEGGSGARHAQTSASLSPTRLPACTLHFKMFTFQSFSRRSYQERLTVSTGTFAPRQVR